MRRVSILLLLTACAAHATAQEDLQSLEDRAIKAAVETVAPSVVRIETFGGLEKVGGLLVGTGPTTGVAVSEDGYILSSAFNFVQKPSSILVTLPSGKRQGAEIVARDNSRMLVMLKVETEEKFTVPKSVPRERMIVGQWSIAVGRTFDEGGANMSVGVISAKNRIWGKAIQTDAKISPSNYGGPLIDIQGRVLGILVPMSPQGQGEIAGAEWYDSGIGFAVPLAELEPHLEKMKKGEDLHAGLLGVSLKGSNPFSDPPLIAAVPARSPAADAGLKKDDTIVEVDGKKIVRIAQLRHALGGHYAGETVEVVVTRGEDKQRVTAQVELAEQIDPYEHPWLGVLPMRDEQGVVVRYVYPGSPAEAAGLKAGDRITQLGEEAVAASDPFRDAIAALEVGDEITLKIERAGKEQSVEATLATLPTEIPAELPAARQAPVEAGDEQPPVGVVEVSIPEEKNECIAYVPQNYNAAAAHGLVVWLHEPGGFDQEKLLERWKTLCEENSLILLAPQAADPAKWLATEVPFIRKTIDDVVSNYNVDSNRVVVHGYQAGGAMSYLVAFGHRDLVRGVAAVDAPVPARARPPAADPIERLAVYSASGDKTRVAPAIAAGLKRLTDMKYAVTSKSLGDAGRYLTAEELAGLVRWVDSLDRI